eukprot:NODE_227_length_2442_cov_30.139992_g170_i1.p1 GENE.NODE_227_length_2442_cov_30.139992_g170_i1~~NODE_227_length_2442_cov_30.139992_g170_i1.p1  ORF type:complete len:701 (-),score=136.70 NODE_227_length_2442_cov_30.139992_g170_i1:339-2351(-)
MKAAGSAQVCAGHSSACEAACHSFQERFAKPDTQVLLLVDASNAFNKMNRQQALRNIGKLAPTLGSVARNVYGSSSRAMLSDGTSIPSVEGTVQGCPIAMQVFAMGTIPLIRSLDAITRHQGWYADDSACVGSISKAAQWMKELKRLGEPHGYEVNLSKTIAVVKGSAYEDYKREFGELATQIEVHTVDQDGDLDPSELDKFLACTLERSDDDLGRRYLGGGIGGHGYRRRYVSEKVQTWCRELQSVADMAKVDPQAAHCLLTKGVVSKWRFLMRTTAAEPAWFQPMEDALRSKVLPALLGVSVISDALRARLELPCRHGGLGVPNPANMQGEEYAASLSLTSELTKLLSDRSDEADDLIPDLSHIEAQKRRDLKSRRDVAHSAAQKDLETTSKGRGKIILQEVREFKNSGWLTSIPLHRLGTTLTDQEWRANVLLRLDLEQEIKISAKCPSCDSNNSPGHLLSCPSGPAVRARHNHVCDELADILKEAHFTDVRSDEPKIRSTPDGQVEEKELFADLGATGIFQRGRYAFIDVRISDTASRSRLTTDNALTVLRAAEREKRAMYDHSARFYEGADFSPFVVSAHGSLAPAAEAILKICAEKMSGGKRSKEYPPTLSLLRARIQAATLRGVARCLVGRSGGPKAQKLREAREAARSEAYPRLVVLDSWAK